MPIRILHSRGLSKLSSLLVNAQIMHFRFVFLSNLNNDIPKTFRRWDNWKKWAFKWNNDNTDTDSATYLQTPNTKRPLWTHLWTVRVRLTMDIVALQVSLFPEWARPSRSLQQREWCQVVWKSLVKVKPSATASSPLWTWPGLRKKNTRKVPQQGQNNKQALV